MVSCIGRLLLACLLSSIAAAHQPIVKLQNVLVNPAGLPSFVQGVQDSEALERYIDFTERHNKVFPTVSAMRESFNNFQAFDGLVKSARTQEQGSARHGVTKFADEDRTTFKRLHTGHRRAASPPRNLVDPPAPRRSRRFSWETPLCLDYRARGVVAPIRDQGQCGDCYAFASLAVLESVWAITYGQNITDLAESEICDCSQSYGNLGCDGGNAFYTYDYVMQKPGLTVESAYSYSGDPAAHGSCALDASAPREIVAPHSLIGYFYPETTDEQVIAWFVMHYGPLYIAIDSTPLQTYQGGVLNPTEPAGGWQVDHAVVIVGFCQDCATGEDYWICRNSWGADWGEEGYFRLIKGTNALNLTLDAVGVTPNV